MITVNKHVITPTIFPDGTSQVWKIPEKFFDKESWNVEIKWQFENEAEFLHVAQLVDLLRLKKKRPISLKIPFLPYARQDKEISNTQTFALNTFLKLLATLDVDAITTEDLHSRELFDEIIGERGFVHGSGFWVGNLIDGLKIDCVVYADQGAFRRYKVKWQNPRSIVFDKVRNHLTGEIESLQWKMLSDRDDLAETTGKKFLIIDDICDGGATFIKIAEILKRDFKDPEIYLFVTHGIFSKGKQILYDAGIREIYTTNSLPRNPEGFPV